MKKFSMLVGIWLAFYFVDLNAQTYENVPVGFGNGHLVKFSPNSDLIAISVGHKVKLFRSGIQVTVLSRHNHRIESLDFDDKGERIMAAFSNGIITVWDLKTKAVISDFKSGEHGVIGAEFLEMEDAILLAVREALLKFDLNGNLLMEIRDPGSEWKAFEFNEKNQWIAVGGKDGRIKIWDISGACIASINSGQEWILSLALTPDSKKLISGGNKGAIHLWETTNWSLAGTLLETMGRINVLEVSNDSKYVSAGGEDFYLLSIDQDQHDVVYRQLHGAVISSSFSPDGQHVAIIEDLTPFSRIYDISDLNIPPVFRFRNEDDNIAPQIYISNPQKITNNRVNYSKDMLDLQGSIFDDFGVRSLKVNGVKTPIRENGRFIIHLPLTMGENPVTIEALDINGNTSLKKFVINRKSKAEEYDYQVARNFLFVVGINRYEHWGTLNNAVKDANDLTATLMEHYNFKFSDITILKDEQATQDNIFKGLRSLIERVTPKDNLLIYYSGHGYFDEVLNEGYWIPVEAREKMDGDYLSNTSILKVIENINSQHTLLIADACFSGSLFSDHTRGNNYIENVEKFRSRWGLASGRLEAVSDGAINSNSPFAAVLLQFLRNNEEAAFPVSELIQNVKMQVPEHAGQTPIGNPLRIRGDEGGEFIFRKVN